ncbi:MAG TPA: ArsR family transcriptional regulator [Candidatus Woesearchaeota archaeon]|nr:ArsR family transcriptional regulator [Candidatus Woesearchaeota archaeon]
MLQTRRKEIMGILEKQEMTLKQLAEHFAITPKEISEDLKHISQTIKAGHKKLVQRWAVCNSCGFVFKERKRLSRPTKCPECRSEDISEQKFSIQ